MGVTKGYSPISDNRKDFTMKAIVHMVNGHVYSFENIECEILSQDYLNLEKENGASVTFRLELVEHWETFKQEYK